MNRKRHYLKISQTVAPYVPGGAKSNWQHDILQDITSNGRELVVEYLPPNEKGDRSAIHGDRFCVEIGRDRDRRDSVFLMRVQSADVRLPRRTPIKVATELVLWPQGYPADIDSADELFESRTADSQEPEPIAVTTSASPLLISMLAALPDALRQRLRPGTDVPEPTAVREFLLPLRQLWARHRLDRHLRVSARQDILLRTHTTPPELSRAERDAMLDSFGLVMLNEVALVGAVPLRAVIDSLAALPIAAALRAQLWVTSLESLSSADLRRELHACAGALMRLAKEEGPIAEAWLRIAMPRLRDVGMHSDESLRELLTTAADDRRALVLLAEWSRGLVFSEGAELRLEKARIPIEKATGQPPANPPAATVADHWVMKLRLPDEQPLYRLREALVGAAIALESNQHDLTSVEALLSFDERTSVLASISAEWRRAVGDVGALRADLQECQSALADLHAVVGADAERLVRDNFILPAEVIEIARLVDHPYLVQAPDWLLSVGSETEPPERPSAKAGWAGLLVRNQRRRCLQMFCDMATELNEPQAVKWLAAPTPGDEAEDHLREWFERVRAFLLELPAEMRGLLTSGGDFRQVQEEAAQVAQIRSELPASLWAQVEEELHRASAAERPVLVAAYGRAIKFFRDELDGCEGQPYSAIRARAVKEMARASAAAPMGVVPTSDSRVTVEHNYLEGRTKRATLHYVPADTGEDYGTVTVPIVLEAEHPKAMTVSLSWDFKGTARTGWSRDWPGPEPGDGDVITIPILGWRHQPDGNRWHFCLSARLPIRTPKEATPRVEVEVTVLDAGTKLALAQPRLLKWESIGLKPSPISVVWGDATVPSHVRDHPIGPQERADALRDRFAAGGNVAVIAPRRFGKSTLVEYLVREGNKAKLLVPHALVCTKYKTAAGFDYEAFWTDVSDRLVDRLGVRLKHETPASLPNPDAFDAVRTAAKKKGYKAVVILLDEAQLFFAGPKGELGSHLKTLLERSLARTDDPKKAPVVFGFIGLPSLRERAGNDLMGVLHAVEKSTMDEAELRPLIDKMTSGLQTTRGARQRLAETAGNLLILKALLESLATRASRDRRVWVNFDDVVSVEELLKKELKEGRELTVATYVRDVLNAADSVDDWRPISSLPVAAAWAHTWTPGRSDGELHERALDLLNAWCQLSQGIGEHLVRPVYSTEQLHRHLQELRERQVLKDSEFASPLLWAWLAGLAARRSFDDSFRTALFNGAQSRIKLPSGAAPVAQGTEATIWRAGEYAYRIRELASVEQRDQFLESVDMLQALRQVLQRRETGSNHIFDLLEMGLSDKNDREAIQVYRWVEGQSLDSREGGLAGDLVIEIGTKLARGLRLLHRNGLLHRDICLRNIVLDDVSDPSAMRPVLIDFGFARMLTTSMRTVLAGPHVAPEVRGPHPDWGRPADIYALSWSLGALLDKADAAVGLRQLLAKGMADAPDLRPTAEHLLESLEGLEVDLAVNERREAAWRELWAAVADLRHLPWFSAEMTKARESLVNVRLRYYRSPLHRYGVIADLLNQLTETCHSTRTSISGLGERKDHDALRTLGAIRNLHVHGRGKQEESQRLLVQRFEAAGPTAQVAISREAVRVIADECRLKSLPALAEHLLE